MGWLARSHPELVASYRQLYGSGGYLPADYREMLRRRAAPLVAKHRLAADHRPFASAPPAPAPAAQPELTLF